MFVLRLLCPLLMLCSPSAQAQQSRAAVIAAMRTADARQYVEAKAWLNKINAPDYVFDKAVLHASIEAEQIEDLAVLERFGLQRLHVLEHGAGQAQVFLLHLLHQLEL